MPTKRPARPIRTIRPTPSTVTRGGNKKAVVIAAIVVLAILAALYWFLSRGPSGQDKQSSVDTTTAARQAGVPASETSSDVGIAMGKARLQLESSGA